MSRLEPDYDPHDEHCCVDEPQSCATKHPGEGWCFQYHDDDDRSRALDLMDHFDNYENLIKERGL